MSLSAQIKPELVLPLALVQVSLAAYTQRVVLVAPRPRLRDKVNLPHVREAENVIVVLRHVAHRNAIPPGRHLPSMTFSTLSPP